MTPEEFENDINKAITCMKEGGIILYPTDTIWGIGCDATNAEAVKKIYALKQREDQKSMLVLVDGVTALEKIVDNVPEVAYELIEAAVKPLTIIYDNACGVAPNLPASDGSLGVRITNERYSKALCRGLRRPIVSTSANISGQKAASFFKEISEEIKAGVDYIAKYRQDDITPASPSNIIKLSEGGLVQIIR